MILDVLLHNLLYYGDVYLEAFRKSKHLLQQVSSTEFFKSKMDEHPEYWNVLYTICLYYNKHGMLPPKPKSVLEFSQEADDFEVRNWLEIMRGALKEIRTTDEGALRANTDPNVVVERTIYEARQLLFAAACEASSLTARLEPSSISPAHGKDARAGVDDAKRVFNEIMSKDVSGSMGVVEGVWQENQEFVARKIEEYLSGKQTRVYMGMPQIDNKFVMRLGKTLVIAGNSGDGKSLLLNSMIYNMARDGERILYNALEFDTVEVWEILTFMHARNFPEKLPPIRDWQRHDAKNNPTITPQDKATVARLLNDIKAGINVPGCIDVVRKFNLDDFFAYYDAHDPQRHYSVVIIDYVAHMKLEGNFRNESDKQAAIDQNCTRLIQWTHEKQKFLFITPAQIGKTAAKEALKAWEKADADERNLGFGYSLDSLYFGNALKQDGDLAISVFSPDDLKAADPSQMKIKCHKNRMTESFGAVTLNVDTNHGMVYDPTAGGGAAPMKMVDIVDEASVARDENIIDNGLED